MDLPLSELKQNAKYALREKYWKIFISLLIPNVFLIYSDIISNVDYDVFPVSFWGCLFLIYVFVLCPLEIGICNFYIKNKFLSPAPKLTELFIGFKNNYLKNILVLFIVEIKILLWSLLFIFPGIIKTYEYAMIPYILAENPNINCKTAFTISKEMMNGNKWDLCCLYFSFIGYVILGFVTLGIGFLFIKPYYDATLAEFYKEVRNEYDMTQESAKNKHEENNPIVTKPSSNAVTQFNVCIYDTATNTIRKEMRAIDTVKFPVSKYADNNTYYAIESVKDGKKTRMFCSSANWSKHISLNARE